MENVSLVDNKKKLIKALDISVLKKGNVVSSDTIYGIEPEYCKLSTGLLLVKDKELEEVVDKGIRFSATIKDLESKLYRISESLKKYGVSSIKTWNANNKDSVKSIRLSSGEEKNTVLVSIKNFETSIDGKKVTPELKAKLGKLYGSIFAEQNDWVLNQSFVDTLIPILKKTFGASFLNKAFTKKTTIILKSKEALEGALSSDLDEEVKIEIRNAIKAPQIAITYPQ